MSTLVRHQIQADPRQISQRLRKIEVADGPSLLYLHAQLDFLQRQTAVEVADVAEIIAGKSLTARMIAKLKKKRQLDEASFALFAAVVLQHRYSIYQPPVNYAWPSWMPAGKLSVLIATWILDKDWDAGSPQLQLGSYVTPIPAGSRLVFRA